MYGSRSVNQASPAARGGGEVGLGGETMEGEEGKGRMEGGSSLG